jgi:hypothetical protein
VNNKHHTLKFLVLLSICLIISHIIVVYVNSSIYAIVLLSLCTLGAVSPTVLLGLYNRADIVAPKEFSSQYIKRYTRKLAQRRKVFIKGYVFSIIANGTALASGSIIKFYYIDQKKDTLYSYDLIAHFGVFIGLVGLLLSIYSVVQFVITTNTIREINELAADFKRKQDFLDSL